MKRGGGPTAPSDIPASGSAPAVMQSYRAQKLSKRRTVLANYRILGFLNSGTYGRVYKAAEWQPSSTGAPRLYAIKKFKPDKDDDANAFRGISQSAIREIALNRELQHENVVWLREAMVENNAIILVYEFVDHDFLQIIHHHLTVLRKPMASAMVKSLVWQLLNGIHYLHENWVMHRDLKPANVLLTSRGVVKIADLGLARLYSDPLISFYASDMVVVTVWYRAPELLLGARHYTPTIDTWAAGCIWGELMALRPMFKGEEARMDPRTKSVPLQSYVSGPSYDSPPKTLYQWYLDRAGSTSGFDLFDKLLQYDPSRRVTAREALEHPWFSETPLPQTS